MPPVHTACVRVACVFSRACAVVVCASNTKYHTSGIRKIRKRIWAVRCAFTPPPFPLTPKPRAQLQTRSRRVFVLRTISFQGLGPGSRAVGACACVCFANAARQMLGVCVCLCVRSSDARRLAVTALALFVDWVLCEWIGNVRQQTNCIGMCSVRNVRTRHHGHTVPIGRSVGRLATWVVRFVWQWDREPRNSSVCLYREHYRIKYALRVFHVLHFHDVRCLWMTFSCYPFECSMRAVRWEYAIISVIVYVCERDNKSIYLFWRENHLKNARISNYIFWRLLLQLNHVTRFTLSDNTENFYIHTIILPIWMPNSGALGAGGSNERSFYETLIWQQIWLSTRSSQVASLRRVKTNNIYDRKLCIGLVRSPCARQIDVPDTCMRVVSGMESGIRYARQTRRMYKHIIQPGRLTCRRAREYQKRSFCHSSGINGLISVTIYAPTTSIEVGDHNETAHHHQM